MRLRRFAPFGPCLLFSATACGPLVTTTPGDTTTSEGAAVAQTGFLPPVEGSRFEPSVEGCGEGGPPLELVQDNILTTDFSGRLRIDSVAVVGEDGGPPNDHGYVNHRYEATVLDAVESGSPSRLTFSVMAEVGVATRKPGQEVFASLCKSTSTYYSPDNGYVFEATKCMTRDIASLPLPVPLPEPRSACAPDP